MSNPASAGDQAKVRIQLTTRHADLGLPQDTGPLLVSTSLRRIQLSSLVNNILSTPRPVPFEFLINGQFLRTSIDDFLTKNGISAETTLTVEYVRALIPPTYVASFEHDDWVSSVDVLSASSAAAGWANADIPAGQEKILSASFDGYLHMWDTSGQLVATSSPTSHGQHPIQSAKFLSPTKLVSAGDDCCVRIWNYSSPTSTDNPSAPASITPSLELYGHHGAINTISVHAPTSRILSASSDHTLGLWSTQKSSAPAAPSDLLPENSPSLTSSNKRRKISQPSPTPPRRGPLSLLTGHTQQVSSAVFAPTDSSVAYSASWDHSLKTWDLPTGTCVDTRTTAHPLYSLLALSGITLLAAGTSARHITLIDPRTSARSIAALTLRGHSNAVVALAQEPGSWYGLVSGSYDGSCRVWDIRSVRPGGAEIGGGQVGESVYRIGRESLRGKREPVGGRGLGCLGLRGIGRSGF
ncbi:ribosome biogenesis protein ytm1 [Coniosporium tulheliwenetii]|uniref:Ribosome biogenesis protein ytm1 n=1 Tax=Coniosporium tulheliwenetii TaxID=3383036 RepID=A0ACC2ZBP9_9PEZI|nr:ribosome biogenesis protein ytm1 [Cladosporium sp. JES 115]